MTNPNIDQLEDYIFKLCAKIRTLSVSGPGQGKFGAGHGGPGARALLTCHEYIYTAKMKMPRFIGEIAAFMQSYCWPSQYYAQFGTPLTIKCLIQNVKDICRILLLFPFHEKP
jgi:hypothetical protein